jgi:hypothetical protein
MTDTVSNLMEASLLRVFNERDAQRRAQAIETAYAPDVRWTDDEGTCVGREALEAKVRELQSHMDGIVLAKATPVYQTRGFGYLAWTLGPRRRRSCRDRIWRRHRAQRPHRRVLYSHH